MWESTAAYLPQVGASYSATRRHASAGSLTGSSFGGARAATWVQAVVNYRTALASLERATALPFSAE